MTNWARMVIMARELRSLARQMMDAAEDDVRCDHTDVNGVRCTADRLPIGHDHHSHPDDRPEYR